MVVFLKLSELGILLWNCFKLYYFFFCSFLSFGVYYPFNQGANSQSFSSWQSFSIFIQWIGPKDMTEQNFWFCYCMNWRRSYDDPAVHLWRIYDPHLLMQSKSEQSLKKFLREACLCSVKQFANRPYFWRILQEMLRLFKCKKSKMPTKEIHEYFKCISVHENSKNSSMHQCMHHLVLKAIEFQNWQEI